MNQQESFFNTLYQNFNDRNIDAVISLMTEDVKWANGMEGGFVYGHEGVREYWTRQFLVVSAVVTPIKISPENGSVKIQVRQVVHDLNDHLLEDKMVEHIFHLENGRIKEFIIGE